MQVIIRGQKVKSELIAKSLAYIEKDFYKPNFLVCFHQRSSFLFFCFTSLCLVSNMCLIWFELTLNVNLRTNPSLSLLVITPKAKTSMASWCITRIGSSKPTSVWVASLRWVVVVVVVLVSVFVHYTSSVIIWCSSESLPSTGQQQRCWCHWGHRVQLSGSYTQQTELYWDR